MIDIISHNPFRILGVFANAPKKEILASKGKITAFTKVGKTIECPSDFSNLLGLVDRNDSAMAKAESQITLAEDRLQATLFWFWDLTSVDKIAFNHLRNGNIDKAVEVWSKINNTSSLQNNIICFLIKGKLDIAISIAEILYEHHLDDLRKILGDDQLEISEHILINNFVHTIASRDKSSLLELYPNIKSDKWKRCVKEKLSKPLIEDIKKEISICNGTRGKDSVSRLSAGEKLMSSAKTFISRYHYFVDDYSSTDYSLLVDKLSEEILMAAIDYYNKTDDFYSPRKALPLMEYAASIAVGQMQKDRCAKNVATIKAALASLPPKEIEGEILELNNCLNNFKNSIKEIKNIRNSRLNFKIALSTYSNNFKYTRTIYKGEAVVSKTYNGTVYKKWEEVYMDGACVDESQSVLDLLQAIRPKIIAIYEKEQDKEKSFIGILSLIVNNALNVIVDVLNEYWVDKKISCIRNNFDIRTIYVLMLQNIWKSVLLMDILDVNEACKERVIKNKESVYNLLRQVDAFSKPEIDSVSLLCGIAYDIHIPVFYYYPEKKAFDVCKSYKDYREYLKLFPNGIYKEEAEKHSRSFEEKLKGLYDRVMSRLNIGDRLPLLLTAAGLILLPLMILLITKCSQSESDTWQEQREKENSALAEKYLRESDKTENDQGSKKSVISETKLNEGEAPFGGGNYDFESLATVTISNPTDKDAVIILEELNGGWYRNAFIKAHSRYSLDYVPQGKYIIRVLWGHYWNSEKFNGEDWPNGGFMKDVAYSRMKWDDDFSIKSVHSKTSNIKIIIGLDTKLFRPDNGNEIFCN